MILAALRNPRIVLALGAVLSLSACAQESVTRGLMSETMIEPPSVAASALPRFDIAQINVQVPRSLKVSEKNTYKPVADIVWHGDPLGDRYEQVAAVVKAGFAAGTHAMNSGRAVVIDVAVQRFHAVTPKTYYTVGGWHEIELVMMVRDARTGAELMAPHPVSLNFRSLKGADAANAEATGRTQKVRIVDHLARAIRAEMSVPANYSGF